MVLTLVADSLDELPEAIRKDAAQAGGKYSIAVPAGWSVEDVKALKSAFDEQKNRSRAAREFFERWHKSVESIEDPESLGEALEALQMKRAGSLKSAKDIETWKADTEKRYRSEVDKVTARLQKRTDDLKARMLQSELLPKLVAKGAAPEAMDVILAYMGQFVRVVEDDDGNLKHSIDDKAGQVFPSKKGPVIGSMDLDTLIDGMRDAPATKRLFQASSAGGSASVSNASGRPPAATSNDDINKMSGRELLATLN